MVDLAEILIFWVTPALPILIVPPSVKAVKLLVESKRLTVVAPTALAAPSLMEEILILVSITFIVPRLNANKAYSLLVEIFPEVISTIFPSLKYSLFSLGVSQDS